MVPVITFTPLLRIVPIKHTPKHTPQIPVFLNDETPAKKQLSERDWLQISGQPILALDNYWLYPCQYWRNAECNIFD